MFSEGLDLALTAYEHRSKIREIGQWLWNRVVKGEVRIMVFGSAGTGKSTLGAKLAGEDVVPDYVDSSHLERYSLQGGVPCSLIVPPGQTSLRAATWSDLLREVGQGKSTIVLHVVSWGLNPLGRQSYTELSDYKPGMTVSAFAEKYAELQRAQEIETLDAVASQLALAPGRLSLITVVLKQDLWWNDRRQVRAFYETGGYAEIVAGIRSRLGEQNFSHRTTSASLVMRNLVDGDGNVLRPTNAGYDEKIKLRHEHELLRMLQTEARND